MATEIIGASEATASGIASALKLARHFGDFADTTALSSAFAASSYNGATATVAGVLYEARNGAWSPVSGDVAGPASSTDNALPRFDGTGGKTLQASGVIVDDSNALSGYRAALSTTTTSGTLTLGMSAPHQRITLDAHRTINAPSSPGSVGAEILLLVNCAGFAITWGTGWAHRGGTPPTLTVTAGVVNVFSVVWAPSLSKWLLIYGGSYS